jgi:hypothetical protein
LFQQLHVVDIDLNDKLRFGTPLLDFPVLSEIETTGQTRCQQAN